MHRNRYAFITTLLLFAFIACSPVTIEGKKAPDFTLQRLSGGTVSLSEFSGRPVLLYWYASW